MGPKIINKIILIITIIKPRIKATDSESWHLKPEVLHIVSEFGWRKEKRDLLNGLMVLRGGGGMLVRSI